MTTRLLKNIHLLITMNGQAIPNAAVVHRDHVIEFVGPQAELPPIEVDETLDLSRHVVMPGMINTHHHMFQNLTRVMAQQHELFGWLTTLYPIWAGITGEMIYVSAKLAMAELILSGCTTSSDHLYLYPNGALIDDEIRAAYELGFRFHPTRGSMSVGESQGGLPPDRIVEKNRTS